jgi:hypothetical protein
VSTHTVKVRPRGAVAWFYLKDCERGRYDRTTLRKRAVMLTATEAHEVAALLERDYDVSAKAVPMFAGHGRSL